MDHEACQITITALGAALSGSIGLNVVLARKLTQQGSMLTKLASASALLNERLIERLTPRHQRSASSSYLPDSRTP